MTPQELEAVSTHDLLRLWFARILSNPAFEVVRREKYRNSWGRYGVRWIGTLNSRLVYVSESDTTAPSTPSCLARILGGAEARLDRSKEPFYFAPLRGGTGMRIEFRYADRYGRWSEVWSPDQTI